RKSARTRATHDGRQGAASPARTTRGRGRPGSLASRIDSAKLIPPDADNLTLDIEGKQVKLTNLRKIFWPQEGYTKGDLLRYYADISHVLLPHIQDRAMVMKRYPNGIDGDFFFMKRTPNPKPEWLRTCAIAHDTAGVIDFPVIDDLAALLWVINLGCIDLNQWYARCDDPQRPDYLHFDLDPVKGPPEVSFSKVLQTALIVHKGLAALKIPSLAKTTGSRGVHIYVPIKRGPTQKEVWAFAKAFAQTIAQSDPNLITTTYKVSKRPAGRVLVDYNQNSWGRTLASVYSVRPRPRAPVSAPVTWKEVERGIEIEDFRLDNMPARVGKLGDLFAPLVEEKGRFNLAALM
ncbi:MAG: non-homologous end-joining DNA ligase, partial [Phycisphaerales bacterium]|nr:non-homologous end-joining DNA ligase [Phycisphaerales bacterium]